MLFPFLVFSENIRGKNIVFRIDNIAVFYGWYSEYVRNGESASEVLKSVHYLSCLFGTTVHVEHVDRVLNEMAQLADELSRKALSDNNEMAVALKSATFGTVQGALIQWLKNPCGNNSLCRELLREQNSFVT